MKLKEVSLDNEGCLCLSLGEDYILEFIFIYRNYVIYTQYPFFESSRTDFSDIEMLAEILRSKIK